MVRSDSEGLDCFRGFGVNSGAGCSTYSVRSGGEGSRRPCLDADRKLSSDPSWSWCSSSS